MREEDIQENNPIFAVDIIHNLKFLVYKGTQISIIRKDCVPFGIIEEKEEGKREFIGIMGGWGSEIQDQYWITNKIDRYK